MGAAHDLEEVRGGGTLAPDAIALGCPSTQSRLIRARFAGICRGEELRWVGA